MCNQKIPSDKNVSLLFCGFPVIVGMILTSASQASLSPKERLLREYEKVWGSTKSSKAHAQSLESGKSHNDLLVIRLIQSE